MSNVYTQKIIVLVGYMSAGKTTIAKEIANRFKLTYYDTDEIIENTFNQSINNIFDKHGELFFRKIEHQVFSEIMNDKNAVIISTGGGLPCYFNNHEFLKYDHVNSIYLKYQPQTLVNRLLADKKNRPLINQLSDEELLEFVSKHLFERNYYYMQAKHILPCDNKSINEILNECISIIDTK